MSLFSNFAVEVQEDLDRGLSVRAIAEKYGVTEETVRQIARVADVFYTESFEYYNPQAECEFDR